MRNVAASVRARLANHARGTGTPLAVLMERFALGRLLWRLSQSDSGNDFILKGPSFLPSGRKRHTVQRAM